MTSSWGICRSLVLLLDSQLILGFYFLFVVFHSLTMSYPGQSQPPYPPAGAYPAGQAQPGYPPQGQPGFLPPQGQPGYPQPTGAYNPGQPVPAQGGGYPPAGAVDHLQMQGQAPAGAVGAAGDQVDPRK